MFAKMVGIAQQNAGFAYKGQDLNYHYTVPLSNRVVFVVAVAAANVSGMQPVSIAF